MPGIRFANVSKMSTFSFFLAFILNAGVISFDNDFHVPTLFSEIALERRYDL